MRYSDLKTIFELGRPIEKDDTFPYIHIAYKYKLKNYRLISLAELYIRAKNIEIPDFVFQFLSHHNQVIMIANIIKDKVISIVFRSVDSNKEFMKLGTIKSTFYGMGNITSNFRYGMPLLLVEGHLDRDMMAQIFPNTLAVMTNHISKGQLQLLTGLTNNFILMFDNDDAGKRGQSYAIKQLKGNRVNILNHYYSLKDVGDLVKLDITNHRLFEEIIDYYKLQIDFL